MPATVSIIIPIRDRAALFAATIESLRRQTYPDWEALVVDDGSSPEQYQTIANLVGADPRIRLWRHPGPRRGACAARNAGCAAAAGDYVLFLDADDALAPDCLAHRLAAMAAHPDAAFIAFPSWRFHERPGDSTSAWNVFGGDVIERFLRGDSPWQTSGPLWRRTALAQIGPWDERLKTWQDSEFHIRALLTCGNHLTIAEADAYWRTTGPEGSISSDANRPYQVVNRARMLARIGVMLRARGALNRGRRRSLSMMLFQHAFRTLLPRRRALAVWSLGRRSGVVRWHEYWLALLFDGLERVARRLSLFGLRRLYPDFQRYPAAPVKPTPSARSRC